MTYITQHYSTCMYYIGVFAYILMSRDSPIPPNPGHTGRASLAPQSTKCWSHWGRLFERPSSSSLLCRRMNFDLASLTTLRPLVSPAHRSWGPGQSLTISSPCFGGFLTPYPLARRYHFAEQETVSKRELVFLCLTSLLRKASWLLKDKDTAFEIHRLKQVPATQQTVANGVELEYLNQLVLYTKN